MPALIRGCKTWILSKKDTLLQYNNECDAMKFFRNVMGYIRLNKMRNVQIRDEK